MCEFGFDKKYRLVRHLGKGASAEVYLTERCKDKKLFAAKMIKLKKTF